MKRFIASAGALVLATAMLASCSAYKNPENYITIPDLSSISISRADLNKTMKEQIDEIIENNREENYAEISEAAKNGDRVNIDYEGRSADPSVTLSETALAGMKAEKQDLILGSGSTIGDYSKDGELITEGFEDQIVGMKAGDTKEITVTFPDKYSSNTELQGKKVIFKITVHSVSRLTVDEECLLKVEYAFTDPSETVEEDKSEEESESTPSTASSASDDKTSDDSVTDDSLEDDEEDTKKFTDLFEDGDFELDYAAEADDKAVFNKIFKIDDFREDFIGLHLYDEIEKKVTVPEDADDDFKAYAGKEISITFTVNSATVLPEWNDEFIKEYTSESYTTVAAYEEALMEDITNSAAYEAVVAAVTVDEVPQSEFDKLYKQYVDQSVDAQVQQLAGKTLDELTEAELDDLIDDTTMQSIRNSAASQALADVKERLIWEYLFEQLDITLSKDEYKTELEAGYEEYVAQYMYYYYSYYGIMFADAQDMEDYYGKEGLELQFKFNKLVKVLPEKITITE